VVRKIWVISELYYPEETSTGYYITRISEDLAKTFSVGVLCAQPTYAARGMRAPRSERLNGVEVKRCWSTTLDKDVFSFRFVNLVTFCLSFLGQFLLRIGPGETVLAVTNPPALPLLAMLACRLRKAHLVLLMHDVYPEALVAAGRVRRGSLFERALEQITQSAYEGADRIIVIGRDMKALVEKRLRGRGDRVVTITNWADVEQIVPTSRADNVMLNKLGLSDKFVVQYAGNMGGTHDLECLLDAAERAREYSGIHFLLVGSGAKRRWVERRVESQSSPNVTILNRQDRAALCDLLNACDLAIIPFLPGMAGVSVPSRMYNILAAGKPIIAVADRDSELARVVEEEKVGWVVPPGETERIVDVILEAHSNLEGLAEMGRLARSVAEHKYSFDQVIEAYGALMGSLDDDAKQ
jgi:glycosyltransferase involved in cell wall biosynthesis